MAWLDFIGGEIKARPSPVESDALGVSTGRVDVPLDYAGDEVPILDAIAQLDVDLVILRLPANQSQLSSVVALTLRDSTMLHTDTLVYWETQVDPIRATPHIGGNVPRPPREVRVAVEEIFAGYRNHYSSNPLLSATSAASAYGDWAARHVLNEQPHRSILIDGELAGLATYSVASDHVEVLLAGIRPKFRRQGHYGTLLRAVEAHAVELGIDRLLISTQIHNYAVQRAWARYGMQPVAAIQTFHVVSDRAVRQSWVESSPTR